LTDLRRKNIDMAEIATTSPPPFRLAQLLTHKGLVRQ